MTFSPATTGKAISLLVALISLCLAVGAIAGIITIPEVKGWYQTLVKPELTPPDQVFGPVWTTLYVIMAVAAWRAWRHSNFAWSSKALWLFLFQLTLNFAWSFLFFHYHWLLASGAEIAVLWLSIVFTVECFMRLDRVAGFLMLPYLAWVSYATMLTWEIWRMNPVFAERLPTL